MRAIYRRPSGFSEPSNYESTVTIVGYVWGKSQDVGRYSDHREECAMAIVVTEEGSFKAIPLANLSATDRVDQSIIKAKAEEREEIANLAEAWPDFAMADAIRARSTKP